MGTCGAAWARAPLGEMAVHEFECKVRAPVALRALGHRGTDPGGSASSKTGTEVNVPRTRLRRLSSLSPRRSMLGFPRRSPNSTSRRSRPSPCSGSSVFWCVSDITDGYRHHLTHWLAPVEWI